MRENGGVQAIILTAGSSRRMLPLTDRTHKTLLEVGGRKVIEWVVDALLECGVRDVAVVTGHEAEALRAFLDRRYPDLPVTYLHNERYRTTNNICSLALALERLPIDSDVLLLECDLVFEPAVLRRLVLSPHPNVALVDRYRPGMDGTVVSVADGVVTDVVTPDRQGPEFRFQDRHKTLNLYRFSREFCTGTFRKLVTHYASAIDEGAFYELVLGIIVHLQHETVHAEVLDGERWAELDDPNDLAVARYLFEPSTRLPVLEGAFGGLWNYDVLDFAFLRNHRFPTGAVLSELRNNLPGLVSGYGSAQAILDRKLATYLLCREDRACALNGASQAFPWLREFFAGWRVLLPAPTFGEYARAFPGAGTFADDVGLDPGRIEEQAEDGALLVLVSPNNPTGSTLPTAWIHDLAARRPGTLILLDESFVEFSGETSLLPRLEAEPLPNVIVLKSLGKSLGVPGLRLGCLYTTHPGLGAFVRRALPVWNLNSLAEHFLEIALKHRPAIAASFERTRGDRARFAEALARLPVVRAVHPSGGNFLLVSLRRDRGRTRELVDELVQRHGVFVKDVSSRLSGPGGHLRLAVRLPRENARLVEALAGVARGA